ncbi:metal transporter [Halobacteriales archaeon QS_8_69_26]|nr:MAG: metal transporter [Halobacteriales archaeon QS_8_69_26]
MNELRRRTLYFSVGVAGIMLAFAVAYDYGMWAYEGSRISFLHAVQIVVETFTTTGYGSDAPWTSPQMNVLVIVMDLTGTLLIFLALPVVFFPLLEDVLTTTAPEVAEDVSDHVVIATHSPRASALVSELDSQGVDYVVVEPDDDRADDLFQDGYDVINADPDSVAGLEAARLPRARALVADVSDRMDVSIVLTAREVADDVRVVSVLEHPERASYHRLAGSDAVLSPRSLLGESLARKVLADLTTDLGEAIEVGEDFDVAEVPVPRGSDLVGRTIAEAGLRERAGINVVGAWFAGEFVSPPSPDAVIEPGTVLLVTGRPESIESLAAPIRSEAHRSGRREAVVVGHGEVGRAVTDRLAEAGLPYTVVDREDRPAVDVVGDGTDPAVLQEAGVESAGSVVLALPDDTETEFATLVIRDLSDDVEVIARAEDPESVTKTYRAGADYVLSLATVTGRITASAVLDGGSVLSPDTQVQVIKTQAPGLAGRTLGEAQVRSRTGCTVVAVERNGQVFTDVGPRFRVETGDEVVVAGTDEGTNRFVELLGPG